METAVKIILLVAVMIFLLVFASPVFIVIVAVLLRVPKVRQSLFRTFKGNPKDQDAQDSPPTESLPPPVYEPELHRSPLRQERASPPAQEYYPTTSHGKEIYPWEMPPEKLPWD